MTNVSQTEFLFPRGAWYLEKYTDDAMRTFPRGSTFYEGKQASGCCRWFSAAWRWLSFSLPQVSVYELLILLLSLKYCIGTPESKVNFVKLYKKLKFNNRFSGLNYHYLLNCSDACGNHSSNASNPGGFLISI